MTMESLHSSALLIRRVAFPPHDEMGPARSLPWCSATCMHRATCVMAPPTPSLAGTQGAGSGTPGGAGAGTGAGGGGAQQGAPPPPAAAARPSIMAVGRSAFEELEARLAAAEAQAQAQAHAPGAPDSQRQPPP